MIELNIIVQSVAQAVAALCGMATAVIGVILLFRQSFMHKMMNSRLDELKVEIAAEAHAIGLAEGMVTGRKLALTEKAKLIQDSANVAAKTAVDMAIASVLPTNGYIASTDTRTTTQ